MRRSTGEVELGYEPCTFSLLRGLDVRERPIFPYLLLISSACDCEPSIMFYAMFTFEANDMSLLAI